MIPSYIEPSWYRSYWYDERPSPSDRPAAHLLDSLRARRVQPPRAGDNRRRLDPALLGLALLFAALAIGAMLITLAAPVPPADLPYFVT